MNTALHDFLDANQCGTVDDVLAAGTIADTATPETIADDMLSNWTFDGQLIPDRAELVAWLRQGVPNRSTP